MQKHNLTLLSFVLASTLFIEKSISNDLSIEHSRFGSVTIDADAKKEINRALKVENENKAIYFVTVSRNPRIKLSMAEWRELKDILEGICGDTVDLNKLSAHADMREYANAHKDELEKSCKIVVFSEHFFGRQTLCENDYKKFIGSIETAPNGIFQLSTACKKSIFYPNFLYSVPYDATKHSTDLTRYNAIGSTILKSIDDSLAMLEKKHARILLENLTKKLLTRIMD